MNSSTNKFCSSYSMCEGFRTIPLWYNRVLLVIEDHEDRAMLLILVVLLFKIVFRESRYVLNVLFDTISHFYELIKIKGD